MTYRVRDPFRFDPASDKPFKLSRSRLDRYLNCPRCPYLDGRLGVDRVGMSAFTLNSATDALLTKEFDIDLRCVKMTGINLALRNLYGVTLRGNGLAGEVKLGYRTGLNAAGGFIRPLTPEELRRPVAADQEPDAPAPPPMRSLPPGRTAGGLPRQLPLF